MFKKLNVVYNICKVLLISLVFKFICIYSLIEINDQPYICSSMTDSQRYIKTLSDFILKIFLEKTQLKMNCIQSYKY